MKHGATAQDQARKAHQQAVRLWRAQCGSRAAVTSAFDHQSVLRGQKGSHGELSPYEKTGLGGKAQGSRGTHRQKIRPQTEKMMVVRKHLRTRA